MWQCFLIISFLLLFFTLYVFLYSRVNLKVLATTSQSEALG